MRSYSIVMVAACPFPVNYGSPGAIRELTETLSEMGHDLHVVTYGEGDNLPVGNAQLHRVAKITSSGPQVGPTQHKLLVDFLLVIKLCQVIRAHKIEIIHAHNYEGGLA
ncbi:MAG TPA: glycosyltransferase family 4 protein, partial [Chthoniobacterales bacterium]|nr:glycosyltransferase family 4 protein [Chthoniobacterales bacterium]